MVQNYRCSLFILSLLFFRFPLSMNANCETGFPSLDLLNSLNSLLPAEYISVGIKGKKQYVSFLCGALQCCTNDK